MGRSLFRNPDAIGCSGLDDLHIPTLPGKWKLKVPFLLQLGWETQDLQAAEVKAPGPTMEQDLRSIPASKLDKFIENHLPDTSFCADLREIIDALCALLKDRSFQGPSRRMRASKGVKVSLPQPELTEMGWERTFRSQAATLIPPLQL